MKFQKLIDVGIEEYKKRLDTKNELVVYLHLPKAAGNSTINEIKGNFTRTKSIKWDNINESWDEFVREHINNPYQFVSGHFNDQHVDRLRQQEVPFFGVTFIRNPIDRIISLYKYNMMVSTPGHESFKSKYHSFEDFAIRGVKPNSMSRVLVRGAHSEVEYKSKMYKKFDFIGLTECYSLSMMILSALLGFEYERKEPKNVSIVKKDSLNLKLSPHVSEELLRRHSLDIAVYNSVVKDYLKLADHFAKEIEKIKRVWP